MAGTDHDAARDGSFTEIGNPGGASGQTSHDGRLPTWSKHAATADHTAEDRHAAAATAETRSARPATDGGAAARNDAATWYDGEAWTRGDTAPADDTEARND